MYLVVHCCCVWNRLKNALLRVIPTMAFNSSHLTFSLADLLTFYLAYLLAFCLSYLLTFYLAYLLTFYLAFYLADLLTFYLASSLAFYMALFVAVEVRLKSGEAHRLRPSPAEVRQGPQRSDSRRQMRSGEEEEGRGELVPGAAPSDIKSNDPHLAGGEQKTKLVLQEETSLAIRLAGRFSNKSKCSVFHDIQVLSPVLR